MAKELPYFRFTVQEWQNGDVSLESYELQGFFINLCGYYWIRDCKLTKEQAFLRFPLARHLLEICLEKGIIKENLLENLLEINFLDYQYKRLGGINKKRSKSGQKGGLQKQANARALLKQKPSYKDKDKEKDNKEKFELFRSSFLGKKNGLDPEYENFTKKNKDYLEITPLLMPALKKEIEFREFKTEKNEWLAPWKNLSTWLNQKCWTQEFEAIPKPPEKEKEVLSLDGHFASFQHFGYEGYLQRMKDTDQKVRLNSEGLPI